MSFWIIFANRGSIARTQRQWSRHHPSHLPPVVPKLVGWDARLRSTALTSSAKNRILEIVDLRDFRTKRGSIRTGQIMDELKPPFSRLSPALGLALERGSRVGPDMVQALERWLQDNRQV